MLCLLLGAYPLKSTQPSCRVALVLSVQVSLGLCILPHKLFLKLFLKLFFKLCMCVSAALNEDPTYFNGTGNTTFGRASICTASEEEEVFCLNIAALFNSTDTGFGWTCDMASNVTAGCPASVAAGETDLTVSLLHISLCTLPRLAPCLAPACQSVVGPDYEPPSTPTACPRACPPCFAVDPACVSVGELDLTV